MRQENQNHLFRLPDGRVLGYAEYGSQQGSPVLHFHGAGSSRLEHPGRDDDPPTTAVRLVVVDRPGHGLSSFQKQRTLLDWARDVNQLADHLGLEQFAVTGWSAGGPYALACAYALPERVKAAALLSGEAPLDYPGAFQGLPLPNRILAWSARYVPWLVYQQRRILGKGFTGEPSRALRLLTSTLPKVDKAFLEQAGVAEMILRALREGYRQGTRGPAQDDVITRQGWRFDLREIRVRVDIWQGGQDLNVPRHAGEYLRATLPTTRYFFQPEEGHFSLLQHWNEIMKNLLE
jgi:pimeloyl-ACP methyl ester carboxylesterase